MGYNGKIEKNKRFRSVVVEEANRVILTGLEMIGIVKEMKESKEYLKFKDIDIRIGINSGKVVAGIIGQKVVRYDIFGSGVLIANKIEHHGIEGRLSISDTTRKILLSQSDIANEYTMIPHTSFTLTSINKVVNTYFIERKDTDSVNHSMLSSDNDDLASKRSEIQQFEHPHRMESSKINQIYSGTNSDESDVDENMSSGSVLKQK